MYENIPGISSHNRNVVNYHYGVKITEELYTKTQADTERVVKVIRKFEGRFANFNEVHESKGKRDRANQEIFLHENSVSLANVPLEDLNQLWLKTHLPSVKKSGKGKQVCIDNFMASDISTAKFLTR